MKTGRFRRLPKETSAPRRWQRGFSRGFTVTELLVAVGILVVLLAIVLVLVNRSKYKAQDAQTMQTLSNVRTAAVQEHFEDGYTDVCASGKAFDIIQTLAAQQQVDSSQYNCQASAAEFVIAFPLKAEGGYWCVDSMGSAKKIDEIVAENQPYSCDHFAGDDPAPGGDGSGGDGSGGGSGDGSGGSGDGSGGDGSGGGTGDSGGGTEGDGGTDPGGEEPPIEEEPNEPPAIFLETGSGAVAGGTQTCVGMFCVVVPQSATPGYLAYISAFDSEDNASVPVVQTDDEYVYTSDIPTSGPGPGQMTIAGIGTYEGCAVTSEKVTYSAEDSQGASSIATRTILSCNNVYTPDAEPPAVSITSPGQGESLTGSVALDATATDDIGVSGVTFKYGPSAITATTTIGVEDTTETFPDAYSVTWNVSSVPSGVYVIVATARDAVGNTTTSAPITVGVNGAAPPPPDPVAGGTPLSLTQLTSDYSRPLAGTQLWYDIWQVNIPGVTALDKYYRFNWAGLNPSSGGYNWTLFDQEIKEAIDAGQKFSFGIINQYPGGAGSLGIATYGGGASAYPQWVHTQMQAEAVKDILYNGDWVPNYNSNSYLTAMETFLTALNAHLNGTTYKGVRFKDVITTIDIRGYGAIGDWQNYPYGNTPSTPTSVSLKRIVDAYKNAFPDVQLLSMISAMGNVWGAAGSDVSYYLLTQSNSVGTFGIRRDNWGATGSVYNGDLFENNTRTYNGVALKTLIMDKWKTTPVTGDPSGSSGYAALPGQVTTYHVAAFSNGNYGSVTASNAINASYAAGHRITIESGTLTTLAKGQPFTLTLDWKNLGATPTYEQWTAKYELRNALGSVVWSGDSSFIPKLFLPATSTSSTVDTFVLPSSVPSGSYTLRLIIRDPAGYRSPYPLNISGRQSDGSYILRSVTI